MTLEETLKPQPIKWVDEQLVRQYTKLSKKFDLDNRKKKYLAGVLLDVNYLFLCAFFTRSLPNSEQIRNFEYPVRFGLYMRDWMHNSILFSSTSRYNYYAKAVDPELEFHKTFSSITRPYLFLAGAGLIGKTAIDFGKFLINGEPMNGNSLGCLGYGMGLLSFASSHYIKGTDPKSLEKESFWKVAYSKLVEKLIPSPQPVPVPVKASLEYEVD
ncbi:MAG TPA: hypothetical protein VJJ23_05150 [Candidatus Nanoarchaeia archaeon]|nr:hypothetical protein [Candidatus Nanoarchaeia archaeon]